MVEHDEWMSSFGQVHCTTITYRRKGAGNHLDQTCKYVTVTNLDYSEAITKAEMELHLVEDG